jgi:tetratricopeptide (TPR) repeat protein
MGEDRVGGTSGFRTSRWRFRIAAAVVIPLLGLLVLELGLRLVGFGYSTRFLVRHPAVGSGELVENQRFPRQFFPPTRARYPEPVRLAVPKPPGTVRVFVFGESAAMGDPAPAFSVARVLEVLLRERHPGTRFEVMNVAFTAINSHVIRAIARDCRPLGGDVWLVYMGHNEVVGPFGTGTIFSQQSPPLGVIRASLALKGTRVGQFLDATLEALSGAARDTNGWAGMDMFLGQQVRARDPRLRRLESHFRRNLDDIIGFGVSGGAQVMVSTMPSRVRDWPPFSSLHRAGLEADEAAKWKAHFEGGVALVARGEASGAIAEFTRAAALDDEHAELHYHWGQACLALGQQNDARTHLLRARDLDALRFRTDTRLNAAIRETVEARADARVRLVEAEAYLTGQSPQGVPGEEWFYEHVHLTFAGNYRLARLFAEEVERALAGRLGVPPEAEPVWLSEAECAARLGYTENQQYEIGILLRRRFGEAIYRGQVGYSERFEALQQRLAELRNQTKPIARRQALQLCREASARAPEDWVLHDLIARLLVAIEDLDGAAASWRRVTELIPHWPVAYTELGKLDRARREASAARAWFARAIEVNPDCAAAYAGLGTMDALEGHPDDARRRFRQALRLDPTCEEAVQGLTSVDAGGTSSQ